VIFIFTGEAIQNILQKTIAILPQKQQLFFVKYFNDLKYTKISEILKTSFFEH
jgi:hypothetical protein